MQWIDYKILIKITVVIKILTSNHNIMKAFVLNIVAVFVLLTQPNFASVTLKKEFTRNFKENSNKATLYETDGHYWTVLVVATLLKNQNAKEIAFSAEYPDNVINEDGYIIRGRMTYLYPKAQREVHALTGGNPDKEIEISMGMLKNAKTSGAIGTACHRLGDSFAHINNKKGKMYPHLIGHLLKWKKPDMIRNNSDKYLAYVLKLVEGLGGLGTTIDMTVFNYIAKQGYNSEENEAILKAEYNILNNSPAFNLSKDQVVKVELYLKERLTGYVNPFIIHSNKDNRGRVTTTVILTSVKYVDISRANQTITDFSKLESSAIQQLIYPLEW